MSVFITDMNKLINSINFVYSDLNEKFQVVEFSSLNNKKINDFIDPKLGGKHFPKFAIWEINNDFNFVFFASNYEDGLHNLTRRIASQISCDYIDFVLSNCSKYPKFLYRRYRKDKGERVIQLLKDYKWEFNEFGEILQYEDIRNYKKNKSKRLSNELIFSYLKNEGINVENIFNITKGFLYERISW